MLVTQGTTLKISAPPAARIRRSGFVISNSAAFGYRFHKTENAVFVWPNTPESGSPVNLETNGHFNIAGEPILLNLKVVAEPAVQQVIINFPQLEAEMAEREGIRAQLRAEVEAEFAAARADLGKTSQNLAKDQVIDAALKRLKCARAPARGLDRYLRLTTKRICEFGDWIFVEAVLDNIRRDVFELRDIKVEGMWGEDARPLNFDVKWIVARSIDRQPAPNPLKLRYDDAVRGMFLIQPPTDQRLPDSYTITIQERGGLKRTVVADDIEF